MGNNSQLDLASKINLSKIQNEDNLIRYGEAFQNNILKSFLLDHQFYLDIYDLIDKSHFSKYQSYIFEQFIFYFEKYNKLPAKETILLIIQDDKILEDNKKSIAIIVDDIYNLSNKINDIDYYKDKVIKFIRNNRVKDAIFKSIKLLQEEDYDSIIGEITGAIKSIEKNKKLSFNFMKNLKILQEFIKRDFVPTPYDVINKIIKGGLGIAELSIILGGTSAGKSFLSEIISMSAFIDHNMDVVYYTLEMGEDMVAKRLCSILLKKTIDDVTDNDVKNIEKIAVDAGITAQYHIVEYPSGTASINTIKQRHMILKNQYGINPKLVVVDYPEIMKAGRKRTERRTEISDIYTDLRGWSKEEQFAILTPSQTNRGGWNKKNPNVTDAGEDFGKITIADFVLILGRSVEDRLAGTGRAIIGKNRNGKDSIYFPMKIDLDKADIDIFDDIQEITNPNEFKEEFDNIDYISELLNGN
jgi:replicative DNA helicase